MTNKLIEEAVADLNQLANPEQAKILSRFFKTGPGEYGEGDKFLGIKVPAIRSVAKKHRDIGLDAIDQLLHSHIHEERMLALIILVDQFKQAAREDKKEKTNVRTRTIYDFYLKCANENCINNWDLVDCSAPHIVGAYLWGFGGLESRVLLDGLAQSQNIWERRIAIIATQYFIRQGEFDDTLRIADSLIGDEHDLIHKAVGWMLREVGNRDQTREEEFLKTRYKRMPRTMLRYAIEKFEPELRKKYLNGTQ